MERVNKWYNVIDFDLFDNSLNTLNFSKIDERILEILKNAKSSLQTEYTF